MGFSRLSGGGKLELRPTEEVRYRHETDSAVGTKCGTQGKFLPSLSLSFHIYIER